MNSASESPGNQSRRSGVRGSGGGRHRGKSLASLVLVCLLAAYALLQPELNSRFGWNLPGLPDGTSQVEPGSRSPDNGGVLAPRARNNQPAANQPTAKATVRPDGHDADAVEADSGNSAKNPPGDVRNQRNNPRSDPGSGPTTSDPDRWQDYLKSIGADRYRSPEGLLYTPGSAEGHRLEHLRRHTIDQPERPGPHGVFDGGMLGALQTIDSAYAKSKRGIQTTKRTDQGRTIYTVDLGHRVGFVGGREGQRRRHPMARRVRLVLEDARVITAYPL
ncbi:hypothetical protein FYK55_11735 [Roseiconus nitratireducens]|uniref:Uncharacterized protein n=1 Tax=Roseiconus nitratireducens TaxID=2605748 RepID=A0A5M6D8Z9_9BACT|nr:hypothetical protein [Roseiconus nitratireducens]KAA5543833.1 hypothetical protein FYK55_11735 [Roseiconus nitratireducens]